MDIPRLATHQLCMVPGVVQTVSPYNRGSSCPHGGLIPIRLATGAVKKECLVTEANRDEV